MVNHLRGRRVTIIEFRKAVLIGFLCLFFMTSSFTYAQSRSKEALGNILVQSIVENDAGKFKSTLLPKEVAMKLYEKHDLQDMENKESLLAEYATVYDEKTIPRFENNFEEIVHLSESENINWTRVEFMILYKYASKDDTYLPFLIHTTLAGSVYKHFYFEAVRYNGSWYLEGKMEVTKGEKYAPK